jgi:dethiobiotin synthetase
MKGYFITGTDTGVGKTFVTASLARLATRRGARVFAYKPVSTGCAGAWGEDQERLARAAGDWQQGPLRGLYQLAFPAAPLVAAAAEGRSIDVAHIEAHVRAGSSAAELTLVEGAGGWRVPITPEIDMAALARRLGFPVIVVARASLGTINHSLLTLEAVERDHGTVAALVLSRRPEDADAFTRSNVAEIARRWYGRILVMEDEPEALVSLL